MEYKKPILLSQLGARLSHEFEKAPRELVPSKSLAGLLHEFLGERIDWQGEGPTLAVFPKNSDVQSQSLTNSAKEKMPRYPSKFWSAFAKPLDQGLRRFMRIYPPYDFVDQAEDIGDENFAEIPKNYTAPSQVNPGPSRNRLVGELISSWLKTQTNLNFNLENGDVGESTPRSAQGRHESFPYPLLCYLDTLTDHDLSRIHIPADIVRKLFQKYAREQ